MHSRCEAERSSHLPPPEDEAEGPASIHQLQCAWAGVARTPVPYQRLAAAAARLPAPWPAHAPGALRGLWLPKVAERHIECRFGYMEPRCRDGRSFRELYGGARRVRTVEKRISIFVTGAFAFPGPRRRPRAVALGYGPTAAGPRNSIIARGRRPCRRNQSRDDSSASLRPSAAFDSTKIPTADTHHFLI